MSSSKSHHKSTSHGKSHGKSHKSTSHGKSQDTGPIDLYCAVYRPRFGNFYHMAFATTTENRWNIFEVVQDKEDGPFRPDPKQANPTKSDRCLRPLLKLGELDPGWWNQLVQEIGEIAVPGEGLSWNCQDYVMDIWEVMLSSGMITEETHSNGKHQMIQYYGQDLGNSGSGEPTQLSEEEQKGPFLSQEYVYSTPSDNAGFSPQQQQASSAYYPLDNTGFGSDPPQQQQQASSAYYPLDSTGFGSDPPQQQQQAYSAYTAAGVADPNAWVEGSAKDLQSTVEAASAVPMAVTVTKEPHGMRSDIYWFTDRKGKRKETKKNEWRQQKLDGKKVWVYQSKRTTYYTKRFP